MNYTRFRPIARGPGPAPMDLGPVTDTGPLIEFSEPVTWTTARDTLQARGILAPMGEASPWLLSVASEHTQGTPDHVITPEPDLCGRCGYEETSAVHHAGCGPSFGG